MSMDMQKLLQQARKMQKDLEKAQADLEAKIFEVSSCGGALTVKISGGYRIEAVEIDKDMIDPEDKEMLEDSVKIAVNEAIEKVQEEQAKISSRMGGGMPGFGF